MLLSNVWKKTLLLLNLVFVLNLQKNSLLVFAISLRNTILMFRQKRLILLMNLPLKLKNLKANLMKRLSATSTTRRRLLNQSKQNLPEQYVKDSPTHKLKKSNHSQRVLNSPQRTNTSKSLEPFVRTIFHLV